MATERNLEPGTGGSGSGHGRRRRGRMQRFARDQRGSFVILSLFLLITIFITAGIAVDAVRFEAQRARLQNTLDRAILAAADMSQTMEAEDVVASYFEKAGLSEYLATVNSSSTFNTKTVSATGFGSMDTFFMNWLGIPQLEPAALGTAEESISDIEISLVLDISGSMDEYIYEYYTYSTRYGSRTYRYNTGEKKIDALKNAAKEFVDTIFGGTVNGRTSMSIVPYDAQVNVGPALLSKLNVTSPHTYNSCVHFAGGAFDSVAIDDSTALPRADHLDPWYVSMPPSLTVCDTDNGNSILALGGEPEVIKARIQNLTVGGNTSVEIGMKWGAGLLDPSLRDEVSELIDDGVIDEVFEGRPFNHNNDSTMKVMVVMTDGQNTSQFYLNNNYKSQGSGVYRYFTSGGSKRFSVYYPEGNNTDRDGDGKKNEAYWRKDECYRTNCSSSNSASLNGAKYDANPAPSGSLNVQQLTFYELFAEMSVLYHAEYLRKAVRGNQSDYDAWDDEPYDYVSSSTKDDRLDDICDATKDSGVIVFAIGFEVTDYSAGLLQDCASSPSHFYRVDGLEITTAFQSIANAIGKLRLTQ